WTAGDFLVAGILLLSTAFLLEFSWRKLRNSAYRKWILLGIFIIFLLIWGELAVGVFGTPLAGS
ncbi:MAG: hypothetical protein KJO86_06135, partial [Muriicola sp.]|nr:hypothetical protein [Muriicola sp.]